MREKSLGYKESSERVVTSYEPHYTFTHLTKRHIHFTAGAHAHTQPQQQTILFLLFFFFLIYIYAVFGAEVGSKQ